MIRVFAFCLAWLVVGMAAAEPLPPGSVVLLRHALAPGVGDPADFRLDDCATQRNLDERGRAQAQAIGRELARRGLAEAAVFTSRWCRSRETAVELGLGPVEDLPALDSFFRRPDERGAREAAMRDFLATLPADGPPLVLVSHQVNVTALTGRGVGSGAGFVLQLDGAGGFAVVAALPAP